MKQTKAEELIAKGRRLIAQGRKLPCPCPNRACTEHGKCYECVLMHRVHKLHVPFCMQSMMQEKIAALAALAELEVRRSGPTDKK